MKLRSILSFTVVAPAAFAATSAAAETAPALEALSAEELAPVIAHSAVNEAAGKATTLSLSATPVDEADAFADAGISIEGAPKFAAGSPEMFELASASAATTAQLAANSVVAVSQYSATAATAEKRADSYTVLMNQDSFFGFYPSFNGLIPMGDNIDFSFYGIFWTTDGFGTGLGSDLWTEFGAGVAIHTMEGNLIIKPQIGITNGALLSGGVRDAAGIPTGTGGNFLDGIVPSLTMNYSDDSFEAEYYGGYYAAVRNRNDPGAADFLHTWINAGAKIGPKFSAGAHYELLSLTRSAGGNSAVVYQWVGPYVQFSTDNGFFARFTAGADIEDGNDGDFYKLTAGFSF